MSLRSLLLCSVLAAGCGNSGTGAKEPVAPVDAGTAVEAPAQPDDAGIAAKPAPQVDAGRAALTADECNRFVDHAIAISLDAHNKNTPAELRPTKDQLTKIRLQLRGELAAACAKLPRAGFQCAMAAKTKDAFLRCGSPATPGATTPTGRPKEPGQPTPQP